MSQPRILVVEDEPSIADTLVYALRTEGFEHTWVSTAGAARQAMLAQEYHLIVLDVGLPDANGFEFCREVRRTNQTPILFLTARQSEIDRIIGLEIGGDDYVTKPFSPREITARIRAILRRGSPHVVPQEKLSPNNEYRASGSPAAPAPSPARAAIWAHDEERKRIQFKGVALSLTRNEYRLLASLLKRPGRIYSRDELLSAAWDEPEASNDRTVDAHIKLLRAKLRQVCAESDPIETHRGLGYSLRESAV